MSLLNETKIQYYYNTVNGITPKFSFPFSNREEYIAWRVEWREEYAKLSQDIRGWKQGRRKAAVELKNIPEDEQWNSEHAKIQSHLAYMRDYARKRMEMRKAAKAYSIQLRNAVLRKKVA